MLSFLQAVAAAVGVAMGAVPNEDPCETVPRNVVAAVLGVPVVAAIVRKNDDGTSCMFQTKSAYPYVTIGASRFASADLAERAFRRRIDDFATSTGSRRRSVPGLGEDAVDVRASGVGSILFVRKGTATYVFAYVGRSGDADGASKNVELAKRALPFVRSTL